MNKLLSVLLLMFLSIRAFAFEVDGIKYYSTSDTEAAVSHSYYSGDVSIPTSVLYEGTSYSVTSIGSSAFSGCSDLTSISIPESVTSIGNYAFDYCSGLTSIKIPEGVTSIGENAFNGCSGLTSVSIPSSVTSIGDGAFGECAGLTGLSVAAENSEYASVDGVLYNKAKTELLYVPAFKKGTLAIPNTVVTIAKCALENCNKLTEVVVPNSVTSIGANAFRNTSFKIVANCDPELVFAGADDIYGILYAYQYYGLPYGINCAWSHSPYCGKLDALTDCYQLYWGTTTVYNEFYQGNLSAKSSPLFSYTEDYVWTAVRECYDMIDNLNSRFVIDGDCAAKNKMIAEIKCLIAARYFDLFQCYGGLPLITSADQIADGQAAHANGLAPADGTRASVEETVDYMVALLDEAIPYLPWSYEGPFSSYLNDNSCSDGEILTCPADHGINDNLAMPTHRWQKAGAMALKAKILTFAASPLFNAEKPYYDGLSDAEKGNLVWYGNFSAERWERALKACEDFFGCVKTNGVYALESASDVDGDGAISGNEYRLAYRKGYLLRGSKEVLHATRVRDYDNWANGYYIWSSWVNLGRNSYLPTVEYQDMFGWSDGSAFDWEKDDAKINGGVNRITGKPIPGELFFQYITGKEGAPTIPTRDPRLYENMVVNGMSESLSWDYAQPRGDEYEMWVGGYHVGHRTEGSGQLTTPYSTGFGVMKYQLGSDYQRLPLQWVYLSMSEMHLLYAECLAQCGKLNEAIEQTQVVRNRVGLSKTLDEAYADQNLTTDKDALLEQILRERACELGMSNARYFDIIRYKRGDWMTKPLHGLRIYRQMQFDDGYIVDNNVPFIGDEQNQGATHPYNFRYEKFDLFSRVLWGKDCESLDVRKMFLFPFPQNEVNKLSLIQNPGWGGPEEIDDKTPVLHISEAGNVNDNTVYDLMGRKVANNIKHVKNNGLYIVGNKLKQVKK